MQGSLAQIVALTAYGNAHLRQQCPGDFYPSNTTFQFCKKVDFVHLERKNDAWVEHRIAESPPHWFDLLVANKVSHLRLHHITSQQPELDDRISVAFVGGGGRWLIEGVGSAVSDFWEGRWSVGDQNDAERRIWNVSYGQISRNQKTHPLEKIDLVQRKRGLEQALRETHAFAERHELNNFAACFKKGLNCLSSHAKTNSGLSSEGEYNSIRARSGV